jgi:hypothetical protein
VTQSAYKRQPIRGVTSDGRHSLVDTVYRVWVDAATLALLAGCAPATGGDRKLYLLMECPGTVAFVTRTVAQPVGCNQLSADELRGDRRPGVARMIQLRSVGSGDGGRLESLTESCARR